MSVRVVAVDRPELTPYAMPDRFRHDVSYFMTPAGEPGVPPLESGEYWVRREDSVRLLDEGVLVLVSPLDSHHHTEVEITAEQEEWLDWMVKHGVERIRVS
jgi:hypothetical protein